MIIITAMTAMSKLFVTFENKAEKAFQINNKCVY